MQKVPNPMIGAFILSVGQETEKQAVNSIKIQDVPCITIVDVEPVNRAINVCFELAEDYGWEYFLIMGADTIHYENSLAIMWHYMKKGNWCVYGRLDDYYRGNDNYGNHLYNLKALKGYRVDEKDPLYDHKIHADMDKMGFTKTITKEVIGVHHPIWTPKEAFCKHYFSAMRYDYKYRDKYFWQVLDKFQYESHPVNEAAVLGWQEGAKAKEKTLLTKETPKAWDKYKHKFNNKDKLEWKNLK